MSFACLIISLHRVMSRAISFSHRTCRPASMHVLGDHVVRVERRGDDRPLRGRASILSASSSSTVVVLRDLRGRVLAVDVVQPLPRDRSRRLKMRFRFVGRMSQTATISLNSGLWSPTRTPPSSPVPMRAVGRPCSPSTTGSRSRPRPRPGRPPRPPVPTLRKSRRSGLFGSTARPRPSSSSCRPGPGRPSPARSSPSPPPSARGSDREP